jgi:hypothetical protein
MNNGLGNISTDFKSLIGMDRTKKLIIFSIVFILISVVYVHPANAFNSTRTFENCYADTAGTFLFLSMFSSKSINLNDIQVKNIISNMCNFYHEKTGYWINMMDENDTKNINKEMNDEFSERYPVPQSLSNFFNGSNPLE